MLVFDEPTNDLDEESRREFTEYIHRNPFDQLILVVSHERDLISACDKKLDLDFDPKDGNADGKRLEFGLARHGVISPLIENRYIIRKTVSKKKWFGEELAAVSDIGAISR